MTIEEASAILKAMYNDPATDKAVSVHLFGIRHARDIDGMPPQEIAVRAGLPKSYGTEIRKGINLANFVIEK